MGASYYVREVQSRRKRGPDATYVYIAESLYDPVSRRTRIRNLLPLGRKGELDVQTLRRLVEQLNRYLDPGQLRLDEQLEVAESRPLGLVSFYQGLWEQAGFGAFFRERFSARRFGFEMAEVVFALVAQRIIDPGSKLACEHWINKVAYLPELAGIEVDLLYAAMDEVIANEEELRRQMYFSATDLLRLDVSVLFYDTTSTYFEVEAPDGEGELRRYGHSKDERPDRPQAIVGVAVNRDGLPVRHWCFPGDTADIKTLDTVLDELSALRPRKFFFVGDRAMISQEVLDRLESLGLGYLLGLPRRSGWEHVHDSALSVRGRYQEVAENLLVKERTWEEGLRPVRLILCFNPQEAERQAHLREETLESLEQELGRLKQGRGHSKKACRLRSSLRYGHYLTAASAGRLAIDRAKVRALARRDGKYVLLTNDLSTDAGELAQGYKDLQAAERLFGKLKGVVGLRPNHHQLQERIAAHVLLCVCGAFLVRLGELRTGRNHLEIHRTLTPLGAVTLESDGRTVVHRTKLEPEMQEIFEKAGVQPPPKLLRAG